MEGFERWILPDENPQRSAVSHNSEYEHEDENKRECLVEDRREDFQGVDAVVMVVVVASAWKSDSKELFLTPIDVPVGS